MVWCVWELHRACQAPHFRLLLAHHTRRPGRLNTRHRIPNPGDVRWRLMRYAVRLQDAQGANKACLLHPADQRGGGRSAGRYDLKFLLERRLRPAEIPHNEDHKLNSMFRVHLTKLGQEVGVFLSLFDLLSRDVPLCRTRKLDNKNLSSFVVVQDYVRLRRI